MNLHKGPRTLAWLLAHDELLAHITLTVKILLGIVFVLGVLLAGTR